MAKKPAGPKETALRNLREAKEDQGAFNFDSAAMEAEIKAVREKHLGGAKTRLAELQTQRDTIEAEMDRLNVLLGNSASAGGRAKGRASGGRMKRDEKAGYMKQAAAFISGGKGVSRSQVAEHLGIDAASAGTIIKALAEEKTIKKEGDKAATRYFAA